MRNRRRAGEGEAGHDRQNRGERHRRDESEERPSTEQFGEHRCGHVTAGVNRLDGLGRDEHHGPEAQHEGPEIEHADESRRDKHRASRRAGVGHRVEAHQDVWQARGAEHERHAEGNSVERIADQLAGSQHAGAVLGRGGGEQQSRIEVELGEDHDGQRGRATKQQHRFYDLHPRGGEHAAEEHIRHHRAAHDDHGRFVRNAEQQANETTGADHLRDKVERNRGQRAEGGTDAHRHRIEPRGDDIGERVPAEIAQRLGDQKEHHRPSDQPAGGVDQSIEAAGRDQPRDA